MDVEIDPVIQTQEMIEKNIKNTINDINKGLMYKMLNLSLSMSRFARSRIRHHKVLMHISNLKLGEYAEQVLRQSKSKYKIGEVPPQ